MLNIRVQQGKTPEERLAAVFIELKRKFDKDGREPDYADVIPEIQPFVEIELLRARIEEAKILLSLPIMDRIHELTRRLRAIDRTISGGT